MRLWRKCVPSGVGLVPKGRPNLGLHLPFSAVWALGIRANLVWCPWMSRNEWLNTKSSYLRLYDGTLTGSEQTQRANVSGGASSNRRSFVATARWLSHASTMTSPGRSLPLELTIADPADTTSASYHRHFRQMPGVDLKKARLVEIARAANTDNPFDVLILPLPNCHGVPPASGLIRDICKYVSHVSRKAGISSLSFGSVSRSLQNVSGFSL